jgi:hypothetical protein
MAVILKVIRGDRPLQPVTCSGTQLLDNLWSLLQKCWKPEPNSRPTAVEIVEELLNPSIQLKSLSSTTDWDATLTSKFRRTSAVEVNLPTVAELECMIFSKDFVFMRPES